MQRLASLHLWSLIRVCLRGLGGSVVKGKVLRRFSLRLQEDATVISTSPVATPLTLRNIFYLSDGRMSTTDYTKKDRRPIRHHELHEKGKNANHGLTRMDTDYFRGRKAQKNLCHGGHGDQRDILTPRRKDAKGIEKEGDLTTKARRHKGEKNRHHEPANTNDANGTNRTKKGEEANTYHELHELHEKDRNANHGWARIVFTAEKSRTISATEDSENTEKDESQTAKPRRRQVAVPIFYPRSITNVLP